MVWEQFQVKKNAATLFLVFVSRRESNFLTVCRNDTYDTPLDSYGVGASPTCWTLFKILHGFEGISKTVALPSCGQRAFLRDFFCFVRPIDSIVTRLDSSRRGAPFVCKELFLTPYSLKVVLIILKTRNSFFADPESTKWTAFAGNRTASDSQTHCIIAKQNCKCFSRNRKSASELHPRGTRLHLSTERTAHDFFRWQRELCVFFTDPKST